MSFMSSADGINTRQSLSPFLLLVHHQHSFMPLDPTRTITNLFLPEGFPAHPHSGFSTVTITLDGGLKHRDSEGIIMEYGDGDIQCTTHLLIYLFIHLLTSSLTQGMASGRGVIHEEMWNTNKNKFQKIELYQLWVNLPEREKHGDPTVTVLRNESVPVCYDEARNKYRVISGSLCINNEEIVGPGNACTSSPLAIIQVKLKKVHIYFAHSFIDLLIHSLTHSLICRISLLQSTTCLYLPRPWESFMLHEGSWPPVRVP